MSHDPTRSPLQPPLAAARAEPSIPKATAAAAPPAGWPLLEGVHGRAVFSPDGTYRYWLERRWDAGLPRFGFVLLNPSRADALSDDPTTRRLHHICAANGGGAYVLVNLFALVDTHQRALHHTAAVGETSGENDRWITAALRWSDRVVVGWGAGGGTTSRLGERRQALRRRIRAIRPVLADRELWCVGVNRAGSPRHPGRGVRNDVPLRPFVPSDDP